MKPAYICDAVRTPFGRYGGALAAIRTDDLGALPLKELVRRHTKVDWAAVDDVILGNANQAGEDNRNVARMSLLLAGLPATVPGVTVNRLCSSGLEAIGQAARAIAIGEMQLALAGGVESMSRAPFVMGKASAAFSRDAQIYDTTIGWRFVNPHMKLLHGTDSMPETAENIAGEFQISRADQDVFAFRSQEKTAQAQQNGALTDEIVAVEIPTRKGEPVKITQDEHPRATTLDALAKLKPVVRPDGTVTAGNASGVNDGACAVIIANEEAARANGLTPKARVLGMAAAGVQPRLMGIGPVPAVRKLLARLSLNLAEIDVIELNEAFAAQSLAVLRGLRIADDDPRVNPYGGAIALGHPLGASGARLLTTAVHQLQRNGGRYALCTLCVGVGQGLALALERI
jgi:acetyl-CoA C-acetyltransferase